MNPKGRIIGLLCILTLCTSACQDSSWFDFLKGDEPEGEPIARVYDRYLYQDELKAVVPANLDSLDSASFAQGFISEWAKEQLMIYKAEYNLSDEEKNFDRQIERYRNDLLTFAYQQQYVAERLDTNVSEDQIRRYYEAHTENFTLKENILKVAFAIFPAEAPKISEAEKWLRSNKADDQEKFLAYAQKNAIEFSLDDTAWVGFDAISNKIPVATYNQVEFLNRNRFVSLQQNNLIYLLKIKAYKIADNPSPLPYVREMIRSILINQRRMQLIEELQRNLLADALAKEAFETYEPKP